jgi:hypothetical protein
MCGSSKVTSPEDVPKHLDGNASKHNDQPGEIQLIIMTCNIIYSKDNLKVFDIRIDSGSSSCGGAGSIDNDKIILCKICNRNGHPHEPIIFRKVSLKNGYRSIISELMRCMNIRPKRQRCRKV